MTREAKRLYERQRKNIAAAEWRREQARLDSDLDLAIRGGDWGKLWSMVPQNGFIQYLIAELKQDYDFIVLNGKKNATMSGRIAVGNDHDEFAYAALGYTLHNLYNAFEGYFFRIAKFFENNISDLTWHKGLLERMTLDIDGVRPALFGLDFADQAARNLAQDFLPYHERFLSFLQGLVAELDGETA